ncbi:MAG TPA: tRNA uridine-5-carboxymethylaminomethyl(34) synthesis GTPase MnmE [Candidatus Atribacteria bacterium]|nr:tRNA uridine-5-carboxymethylaminomethyl(34) synthesis GTPase MnmE [Candidatus Atribacteria bacterium]
MKFWENDTIAAISTPIGESGIGIVRISGPKALEIAQEVFRDKNLNKTKIKSFFSHTVHYGFVIDPESGEKIDEVILVLMKKPQTYTREDTVEFNCHGGILSLRKVLETVINCGARMAEPGEFTKRAFLNGRIDLSQAEAVIDLIQAKTERSLSSSLAQLGGSLRKKIADLRNRLIRISAEIEAPMDFPEQDIKEISPKNVEDNISYILKEVNSLIETLDYGKILKEGINTLIVGKANVGKSSLFNILLRENRAIVTHIPGTTRDTIEELINIKGIAFKIIDTAGLKNPENVIEKISIKKMMKHLREAKLILAMFDVSVPLSSEDKEVIKEVNKEKNESKKVIVIENKIDLSEKIDREKLFDLLNVKDSIKMSLEEKIGIEELEEKLVKAVMEGLVIPENGVVINNVRQANQLNRAKHALENVLAGLKDKRAYDFLTIDLRDALDSLGEITGDSISDEIVNDIFSRFCIGK